MPSQSSRRRNRHTARRTKRLQTFESVQMLAYLEEMNRIREAHEQWVKFRTEVDKELFNPYRLDMWTGLRYRPDSGERNWTTRFCLRYKNSEFPEDVLILINEYLNWVPAGCWSTEYDRGCNECGIRYIDNKKYGASVCSWQCYGKQ